MEIRSLRVLNGPKDNRHVLLVHLGAVLASVKLGLKEGWSGALLVVVLPYAIAPLVLSVVRGRRLGLFGAFHASLLGAVICLPVTQRLTFLVPGGGGYSPGAAAQPFVHCRLLYRTGRGDVLHLAGSGQWRCELQLLD